MVIYPARSRCAVHPYQDLLVTYEWYVKLENLALEGKAEKRSVFWTNWDIRDVNHSLAPCPLSHHYFCIEHFEWEYLQILVEVLGVEKRLKLKL